MFICCSRIDNGQLRSLRICSRADMDKDCSGTLPGTKWQYSEVVPHRLMQLLSQTNILPMNEVMIRQLPRTAKKSTCK